MATPASGIHREGVVALAGLAIGLLVGTVGRVSSPPPVIPAAAGWLVRTWTGALTLVVVPLVVAQLFVAVAMPSGPGGTLRRFGLYVPLVFGGLLVLGVVFSITATSAALRLPVIRSLSAPAVAAIEPEAPPTERTGPAAGLTARLVASARSGDLLTLMAVALAAGLGSRSLQPTLRQKLCRVGASVSRMAMLATRWLVHASPLVLVAVGVLSTLAAGWQVGPVLLAFTLLTICLAVTASVALYVLAAAAGVPVASFARAAASGQLVAAASRSSLASVPVLVSCAETTLALPTHVSATVIGVAGATLKLARAVSTPAMLLFIVHVFGLTVTLPQLLAFVVTILVISPASPGIPKMVSGTQAMPAFAAAGIPPAYVVLLGSTTVVADVFETVLNSTGYLAAAVLVHRLGGPAPSVDPARAG